MNTKCILPTLLPQWITGASSLGKPPGNCTHTSKLSHVRERNFRFYISPSLRGQEFPEFPACLAKGSSPAPEKALLGEEMQMLTAGIQLKSTGVERPKGHEQNTDSNCLMS